ncbi:MAG: hypothetical protein ACXWL5_03485 [Candidatus Chromulinivorax sp.]
MIKKNLFLLLFFIISTIKLLSATTLYEKLDTMGYAEISNEQLQQFSYDDLYVYFDQLIDFLNTNSWWKQKLYVAKERFIRSKSSNFYGTHFFGFYDESKKINDCQIYFYYCFHFHQFLYACYPEIKEIWQIDRFLQACSHIEKACNFVFNQTVQDLQLPDIFASEYNQPPTLLKIIKYLPAYVPSKPHYDGTTFTLFLDSTDNQALLLSPYKLSFTIDDFFVPERMYARSSHQRSVLLILGSLLTDFLLYPTPHIVLSSGKSRYATVAFAMKPYYVAQKIELSDLPEF